MWWVMIFFNILIPIIFIIAGIFMLKKTPKKINYVTGYRTKLSMRNMDTWKFAHEHSGKISIKEGLITLILSIIAFIPFYKSNDDVISYVSLIINFVQMIALIIAIFSTQKALKKTFNEDGTRK